MRKIVMVTVVAALALVAVVFLKRDNSYDHSFDTRVANPAYARSGRGRGPLVLYDEGHLNNHLSTAGYKPFADLVRNDGYTLKASKGVFTPVELREAQVLVIVLPRGTNETQDSAAYPDSETALVANWVKDGGSVLLITDHWPFGLAARSLAKGLGVDMGAGLVEDPKFHHPERGASHLIFSEQNGLLKEHPITRGRSDAERVRTVLTFTGQSLKGPKDAVPFMQLSDSAVEYPPTPAWIEKDGDDVRVHMEYGKPLPAAGRAQGIAFELGKGRVVVLGEAGMLRAYKDRTGKVGMNLPGYDNKQLALNVMHWLSRLI